MDTTIFICGLPLEVILANGVESEQFVHPVTNKVISMTYFEVSLIKARIARSTGKYGNEVILACLLDAVKKALLVMEKNVYPVMDQFIKDYTPKTYCYSLQMLINSLSAKELEYVDELSRSSKAYKLYIDELRTTLRSVRNEIIDSTLCKFVSYNIKLGSDTSVNNTKESNGMYRLTLESLARRVSVICESANDIIEIHQVFNTAYPNETFLYALEELTNCVATRDTNVLIEQAMSHELLDLFK